MGSGRQTIIVYVTHHRLMVSLWQGQQYQSHQIYQHQEADHVAFRHYLSQHKKAALYLIVDSMEEEYQLAVLPHVKASVRREMLARKLSQFSRNSDYKTAYFLYRETASRQDDVFVFLALTNPHFLQAWMAIIQSEQALFVGMYAWPTLSQAMVCQMKMPPPQLLFCERLSSGWRQTYFQDGGLRISRLTPIEPLSLPLLSDFYLAEIEKMQLYLRSQRMINDAIALPVMLSSLDMANGELVKALEQRGHKCHVLNRQHAIKKYHLKRADIQAYPELQFMQWLSDMDKSANLAPAELTKAHHIQQLANKIYKITILLMVVGILIAASFYLQAVKKNEQVEHLEKQTHSLLKQQALMMSQSPESPLSGSALKAVVTTAEMVSQQSPLPFLQVMSTVLEEAPEISINRIHWVLSDREDIKDENSGASTQTNDIAEGHRSEGLLQIGFVTAKVNHVTRDRQKTLASAQRFVTNLRADNRVKAVQVMESPLDKQVIEKVQGSTEEDYTPPLASLTFTLKIILHQTKKENG